jgi:DNA-directed RNA polymerase subunit K/omega
MFKVSTEELVKLFENRYEAVVVLAREARRTNVFAGDELKESGVKPILNAIDKLTTQGIEFEYEEVPEDEEVEEAKDKKEKKEKKKK